MANTVLITGATSGIGRELAKWFAADGNRLVLAARAGDELNQIKRELESRYSVRVTVIPVDLSSRDGPSLLIDTLDRNNMDIDVLVNNAGFGLHGSFAQTPLHDELAMIDLHIRSMTILTKFLLPPMVERRQGGILNVSSTAAFQPGPYMAVYYASKSYALSFTEALAGELRGTGVLVTALCPGPTETRFSKRAGLSAVRLFSRGLMKPAEVAQVGYRGYLQGRTVVIPGLRNRILVFAARLAPRKIIMSVVKVLHRVQN